MSDSVRPHRQQPTKLHRPWDSPGKNTGVGCHFLLQCMKVKNESEVAQSWPTLWDPMDCSPPGSSVHGIFQARVLEWGATDFSTKNAITHQLVLWWHKAEIFTFIVLYQEVIFLLLKSSSPSGRGETVDKEFKEEIARGKQESVLREPFH